LLAEEFIVLDSDSPLWLSTRPLLDIALRFDQNDETYSWNGWNKQQIRNFLSSLPQRCSLVVGVWETIPEKDGSPEYENLVIGFVCEIIDGEVCSIRTFDAFAIAGLRPSKQLEPGVDDAREIIRLTEQHVALVSWALFIEKSTWDEWLFTAGDHGNVIDKGELLATLARQGRCVLMGRQTVHNVETF
jgi:hypothetical protein